MKIKLVCQETINDYIVVDPNQRSPFGDWITRVKHAQWNRPSDIKKMFRSASFLQNESRRVVFSIGRKKFRVIGMHIFARRSAYLVICWVGTGIEYRKLSSEERHHIVIAKY